MNRRLNRQKIQRLPPQARDVYQFATFFGRTHESNDLARMVKIGYNLGGAYAEIRRLPLGNRREPLNVGASRVRRTGPTRSGRRNNA